jgi:hypothetical protein
MALVRPRLNDYHHLPFTQAEVDFAIPFLDEDIPFYLDPFLLWKSPSQQDRSLHTAVVACFNSIGRDAAGARRDQAIESLIKLSECTETGLGSARNKQGKRIGEKIAGNIVELFSTVPDIKAGGVGHLEEIQLLVEQISRDRVSDIVSNLIKSFLVDFTLDQCKRLGVPVSPVTLDVFDHDTRTFVQEQVALPVNPKNLSPLLLVPKRWLRYVPWINYEDYFDRAFVKDDAKPGSRIEVLNFNRHNYGMVREYIKAKERTQADCVVDPLFKPIAILSAKRQFAELRKLPAGRT